MSEDAAFEPADLTAFQQGGLLWAVNHFVLHPLGYAISLSVHEDATFTGPIEIREWIEADGHLETIESDSVDDDGFGDRWELFRQTVVDRLKRMPQVEADAAMDRLAILGDVLVSRPRWRWVKTEAP